ncbi:hypothetical protein HanPI659440_Chr12g0468011 [Helianthus annuus]|nr:hypothetical protein HanPI659440_Chr15g0581761 [Helianthus annuus]KAJ0726236.1 hypothetical protein HanPI659440_Chr12g0468011 [Helianthus annuus]
MSKRVWPITCGSNLDIYHHHLFKKWMVYCGGDQEITIQTTDLN